MERQAYSRLETDAELVRRIDKPNPYDYKGAELDEWLYKFHNVQRRIVWIY